MVQIQKPPLCRRGKYVAYLTARPLACGLRGLLLGDVVLRVVRIADLAGVW
jgi:hypothetical protein